MFCIWKLVEGVFDQIKLDIFVPMQVSGSIKS